MLDEDEEVSDDEKEHPARKRRKRKRPKSPATPGATFRAGSQGYGVALICPPRPFREFAEPYDCHPLMNHGSIFKWGLGKI